MKKKADEYLYNEALKYLGKYPATKKKISEILEKRLKNKKTYQLAQKVNVKVLKVDILKNQIDLELVKDDDTESINTNDISIDIDSNNLS